MYIRIAVENRLLGENREINRKVRVIKFYNNNNQEGLYLKHIYTGDDFGYSATHYIFQPMLYIFRALSVLTEFHINYVISKV